jgi:Zn-dependent metalloprotease
MEPQQGSPQAIAEAFLKKNADLLKLEPDLIGLEYRKTLFSLGARHVIMQQCFKKAPVDRAYVTVHMSNAGEVYLVKNRAMPLAMLPKAANFQITRAEAEARAREQLPNTARITKCSEVVPRWYPKKQKLIAAWRVRFEGPGDDWIVYISGHNGSLLRLCDNLKRATGQARVFDPSPVTALGSHTLLLSQKGNPRRPPPEAYTSVTLHDLKPNGRLEGKRVTTNATRTDRRVRRPDFQFVFKSHEKGFEEVMAYYHIDQAIRYLEGLGYRGPRAIFREPVRVNVNGTRQDNAMYSPSKRLLTYGVGRVDEAEDGETILHELGHAIQDSIVPDFGKSREAAAMGEGFGDYFAASFFAEKKPERYRSTVITWDGVLIGLEQQSDPPTLRRVDEPYTYLDFKDVPDKQHDNGKIWSATLWDLRRKLGREVADRIVLDSHFQLDAFTTFARGARAILDADQNLYGGVHHDNIKRVFRRRRIDF